MSSSKKLLLHIRSKYHQTRKKGSSGFIFQDSALFYLFLLVWKSRLKPPNCCLTPSPKALLQWSTKLPIRMKILVDFNSKTFTKKCAQQDFQLLFLPHEGLLFLLVQIIAYGALALYTDQVISGPNVCDLECFCPYFLLNF